MSTFKYTGSERIEIPAFGIRLSEGDTFEVPDEFDARFVNDPEFVDSKRKHPDVVVDPSFTGPVPVQAAPDQIPAA